MAELSIANLEDELKTVREQKDIVGELRTLKCLGSAFQKNRQFTKAASCFSKALKLVQENGSAVDRAFVHASLGCVYWEMAQLKKAMTHFQSALEIQQQFRDTPVHVNILALMGISCWRKCQWEEGLSYFYKVHDLRQTPTSSTTDMTKDAEYSFLAEALERAVTTLQNRVCQGREQGDPLKILQPLFAMIPLYLFTTRKSDIEPLLHEATSLAGQLQKKDIQNAIPKLRAMIAMW